MQEGPWFSPDAGMLWVRDGKAYFEDGVVLPVEGLAKMPMRLMRIEDPDAYDPPIEDYSQWSEAKRQEVRDSIAKKRKEYEDTHTTCPQCDGRCEIVCPTCEGEGDVPLP